VNGVSVADAVRVIKSRTAIVPEIAVILGTGLGALADELKADATIPYPEIPGFPTPIMQGRFHRYEGYTLQQVAFPVRVLRAVGAKTLIVSNVSGGMHPLWATGDLVLISDHINLLGDNPLAGPNVDAEGPRFPDMSAAYDPELRKLAHQVALEHKIVLREGVYVAVPGPNLETRAEYRMLRALGADLVGMSTVPEVITAVHQGMRVLGFSIITDNCLPDALEPTSVEQIIAVARGAEPKLAALVHGVVEQL